MLWAAFTMFTWQMPLTPQRMQFVHGEGTANFPWQITLLPLYITLADGICRPCGQSTAHVC